MGVSESQRLKPTTVKCVVRPSVVTLAGMKDPDCVQFLQWALPKLHMRWPGFRKVRRQVCKRVGRRLRELGLDSVANYRIYLDEHADEWSTLDALCRVSISRFYRDRGVFDLLRYSILSKKAAAASVRDDPTMCLWSAGCASGEEVYTLKIIWELDLQPKFPGVALDLLATDADPHMIERARRGCYPQSSIKDLPQEWLPSAFYDVQGEFCVGSRFRNHIKFTLQDIRERMPDGPFDLICCRHLAFTYFDEALQREVLQDLSRRLRDDGTLVTGKQETLPTPELYGLRLVQPHSGIYRRHTQSPAPKSAAATL